MPDSGRRLPEVVAGAAAKVATGEVEAAAGVGGRRRRSEKGESGILSHHSIAWLRYYSSLSLSLGAFSCVLLLLLFLVFLKRDQKMNFFFLCSHNKC